MSYPIEDAGFTLWLGDLDTQLKRFHGVTSKELGIQKRNLLDRYYTGESVFSALDSISRVHLLKVPA